MLQPYSQQWLTMVNHGDHAVLPQLTIHVWLKAIVGYWQCLTFPQTLQLSISIYLETTAFH